MCHFTQADNYAPVTVGQLKNVATAFYDRLGQIGYNWQTGTFGVPSTPYPWSGTVNAENEAPSNIGQLKNLFTFEISSAYLAIDGDGDGLPSWWETLYGFDPLVWSDANIDSDLDGLNDGGEYVYATNPHLTDTDSDEASDDEERAAGTDPKKDTSTPLAFCYLVHRVNWSVSYLPPVPPNGVESPNPNWFDGSSGYWPRQGDHQGTIFANCYPGRDRLGDFYRVGGTEGPKATQIPIFSSQIPLIPDKDPASAIILDTPQYNPVNLHSEAYFRGDGEGSVYTEAGAVWIRGPKRTSETTYLIRVTKTQQQRAPVPPSEEVTYETIVVPPTQNSSPAKSYIAALSGASAQRYGGESTHLRLDLIPVELQSVTFSGSGTSEFFTVKADDGTDFADPHWKDVGGDGNLVKTDGDHTYPVAYVRNKIPLVAATIKLTPGLAGLRIKASHTDGFNMTTAPLTVPASGIVEIPATSLTQPLPNTIFHYPAFKLTWEISINSGAWSRIGESRTPLYVLRAAPILGKDNNHGQATATEMRYTLVHTGCALASGESTQSPLISKIFSMFAAPGLAAERQRYNPQTGLSQAKVLTFYKGWPAVGADDQRGVLLQVLESPEVLPEPGCQCFVFAEMMRDMLKIQGIPARVPVLFYWKTLGDERVFRLFVKDWTFSGNGTSGENGWPYMPTEYAKGPTLPGQNNTNTPEDFINHAIVEVSYAEYYDPSYGAGPFSSLGSHDINSFSGYGQNVGDLANPAAAYILGKKNSVIEAETRTVRYR